MPELSAFALGGVEGFGAPATGVTLGYWNVWCDGCIFILDDWAPHELRRGFTHRFSASAARRLRAAVADLTVPVV